VEGRALEVALQIGLLVKCGNTLIAYIGSSLVEAAAEQYFGILGSDLVGERESLERVEEFRMALLDAAERVLLSKSNVVL
jgi:hypothetical protein